MGKVLVIDLNICNGCYNCQVACKDEHVANDWSPIAKPQPDTGQFWNKVTDLERGQVPKVKVTYMHSICQHCDDAPCIPACNVEAIYRRDDGAVIIDPDKCRGNQLCLEACPYEDVIYFNDSLNIAQKCTFCAHLLDDGWTEPRCVDACPTGAFRFGDEDDPEIKELIAKAEPLKPELDVKPRVYYIGLPKPFIAGAVFDSEADECTEGATVTATEGRQRQGLRGRHRQLRRLLAQGRRAGRVHRARREGRLPAAEDGPRGRHRTSTSATSPSGRRSSSTAESDARGRLTRAPARPARADQEGPGREARPLLRASGRGAPERRALVRRPRTARAGPSRLTSASVTESSAPIIASSAAQKAAWTAQAPSRPQGPPRSTHVSRRLVPSDGLDDGEQAGLRTAGRAAGSRRSGP